MSHHHATYIYIYIYISINLKVNKGICILHPSLLFTYALKKFAFGALQGYICDQPELMEFCSLLETISDTGHVNLAFII